MGKVHSPRNEPRVQYRRLGSALRRAFTLFAACAWAGDFRAAAGGLLEEYTVRRWAVEDGLSESLVTSVAQAPDGFLWLTTPRQRVRFDGVRFVSVPREGPEPAASPRQDAGDTPPGCEPGHVALMTRGADGIVWSLADGKLFRRQKAVWRDVPLPDAVRTGEDRLTALFGDADSGTLWAGAKHGVYQFHHEKWSALTDRDGYFPWDVRCLALDRQQNLWIGTSGGLVRLRRKVLYAFRTGQPTGDESITALLAETPTHLWVGLAGTGLLEGAPAELRPVRVGAMPQHVTISSLLRGHDGTLWIGTQGDRLWRWRNGQADRVPLAPENRRSSEGISALMEDRRGVLWVGTWDGLMQLNSAGRLIAVETTDAGGHRRNLPMEMVQALYEDSDGKVWAGFQSSGLLCFKPGGGTQWLDQKGGLPSNSIRALFEDADRVFWVGTTAGLMRWQHDTRCSFTVTNGLVDDSVLQILEDGAGYLWLGTRRGIMRIKKTEFVEVAAGRKQVLAARAFGTDEGMFDPQCTGRMGARAARTADGRLWFPTMEGLVMAAPQEVPGQVESAAVYIEEVRTAQGVLYAAAPAHPRMEPDSPRGIRLPTGVRDMEFGFTAPLLSVPERAHFKYRLTGYDADWSRAGTDRAARYTQLAPGRYDFRVMVRDRDGDWSRPSAVRIVVPPFFWETLWGRLAMLIAVIAGVAWGVHALDKQRAARRLQELERRNAIDRERGRIARDIHDDVGAGLTEVAMLSELAQEETRQPGEQRQHLDRIFRRARALTQSLDEIVWAINPANDTLESLVSYVGEFAQDFLGTAGLICRLELPAAAPALALGSTVRHHLCLAVKEALHNIVKHADATEVHLTVTLAGPELTVGIRDNGRGFSSPAAGEMARGHDGLTNLQTRLDEIGGRLLRENRPGQGTHLVLSVILPTTSGASGKAR